MVGNSLADPSDKLVGPDPLVLTAVANTKRDTVAIRATDIGKIESLPSIRQCDASYCKPEDVASPKPYVAPLADALRRARERCNAIAVVLVPRMTVGLPTGMYPVTVSCRL